MFTQPGQFRLWRLKLAKGHYFIKKPIDCFAFNVPYFASLSGVMFNMCPD